MFDRFDLDASLISGARCALALSGGRDSVALAHALQEAGADFFAVHVEHGIRGENSLRDAEFVRSFCTDRGIGLVVRSVDVPSFAENNGLTVEQAARELRYGVFDELIKEGLCEKVILAHHRDDQTETVFMRILRGTGIKGLRGMSAVNGPYVRPLLGYSRAQIDEYIEAHGLPYTDDETNSDTSYTRNFLRRELAVLRDRFPALDDAVRRLAAHAAEADEFIDRFVPSPTKESGTVYLAIAELGESVTAKRAVARACALLGAAQDIEDRHLSAAVALIDAKNGKRLDFPHGITVCRERDRLVFLKAGAEEASGLCGETPFPDLSEGAVRICGVTLERIAARGGDGALYIDGDKLPADAVLRSRREGDYIKKFGGGTKSLGDFFTDKKVPLRLRDCIAVCASGSEILFVAGVEISSRLKIDDDTETIIRISTEKFDRG